MDKAQRQKKENTIINSTARKQFHAEFPTLMTISVIMVGSYQRRLEAEGGELTHAEQTVIDKMAEVFSLASNMYEEIPLDVEAKNEQKNK